jgi:hypothetical protein
MRFLLVTTMMVGLAGCAPTNIAHSSCQDHPLTTADEWTCTVKGPIVDTTNSVDYDTESRNQIAQVYIALQVTKGTLRVTYYDLSGVQHVLVTPSEPANFAMKTRMNKETRMNRETRSFRVMYEPVNGPVEGLTGTVKYSTP